MDELLKIIYDDYYNIQRTLDLQCDQDVIKLVYFLSKCKDIPRNINDLVKLYKKEKSKDYIAFLEKMKGDSYFSARETLHFTYPMNETLKRLDILYQIIGEKEWIEIFGYSYEFLHIFIRVILCRITLFHNLNELEPSSEYKKSRTKECYFTKEELYEYMPNYTKEIDLILKDISIDFFSIANVKDVYKILCYNEHYYLFFIWDFLYNLFNVYTIKIKNKLGHDEFNKRRGRSFEIVCYNNLKECFKYGKIYRGLVYDYKSGNHEVDILIELDTVVVVFECKSGAFDSTEFDSDNELYENFVKVYGRGYKTINDLNNYILDGNSKFRDKDKNTINIDVKNKQVIYINLSLYNIEFIQTNIQKIKSDKMRRVNIYTICWNYIDFLSLTKLAKANYKKFEEYFKLRFSIINDYKNLTLDYDEVDVFGFLMDPANQYFIENILLTKDTKKSDVNINFTISNGVYRKELNSELDKKFLLDFLGT